MAEKTYYSTNILSKNPGYMREHPVISAFLALFIVVIIGSIIWFIVQNVFPSKPTSALQWNGVTAGSTTTAQLEQKLGKPIAQTQNGADQILSYKSSYNAFPHQVITQNGVVVFIEEWVPPNTTVNLTDYTTKFGQPDFTTKLKDSGGGYVLNVFLKQGVAVDGDSGSGTVFHILYFVPTTQTQFMTTFQSYLAPPTPIGP